MLRNRLSRLIENKDSIGRLSRLRENEQDTPNNTTKCGVICQKKKKRKVLFIGLGVLLVGGISYFILKKK